MRSARLLCVLAGLCLSLAAPAQQQLLRAFKPVCDSLSLRVERHTGVRAQLELSKVMKRSGQLDFYFTKTLGDLPWRPGDAAWFRQQITELFPPELSEWKTGDVYCRSLTLEELQTAPLTRDGQPTPTSFGVKDPRPQQPFIVQTGAPVFKKGLSGRTIALWHSHGRYYDAGEKRWNWQRPPLHGTVEDLYTQTYVLPFLIPMLERAGAYVLNPRERDTQRHEVVCDGDPSFRRSDDDDPLLRRAGRYQEKGAWSDAGTGFADAKAVYTGDDNPFTLGSARKAACIRKGEKGRAEARWTPDIPETGEYAVYISYKSLPQSSSAAHYRVRHQGGTTDFVVDQRKGGSTWIYLGTFPFVAGTEGGVTLDNQVPAGYSVPGGSVVTADALRFGGGMGKIARGPSPEESELSGLPAYCEGARYAMQWAGVDEKLYKEWDGDYTQDYAARGAWVRMMQEEKGIPIDLSLAFHSDAGTTPNDSLVGTLAIYSLRCEGSRKYVDGSDRLAGRLLADLVQTQICEDLRANYEPEWTRREIWDRSYSESRTSGVPGMILELLSHQNFADMRYGLDPMFRFMVSRSVYKGILKFLSSRYGYPYAVQPLPVQAFSALPIPGEEAIRLKWEPTPDPLEPTASAKSYLVYTRLDDGAFDAGVRVTEPTLRVPAKRGTLYSFRIEAVGEGGRSFPSEILSAALPQAESDKGNVLIVNNFTRIAPPAWFDTPSYAGFDHRLDGGLAWGDELGFTGGSYEYRREQPFASNYSPGFGASESWMAGRKVAGNHFDYPAVHGRALLALGRGFGSESRAAFLRRESVPQADFPVLDLLCGKQAGTPVGNGRQALPRHRVFPREIRQLLDAYTTAGGNVLLSGANIATDVWDELYPLDDADEYRNDAQAFVTNVLGYRYVTGRASHEGCVAAAAGQRLPFWNSPNERCYCVENPDGIRPASRYEGRIALRYADSLIPAAVFHKGAGYRVAAYGFPLECLKQAADLQVLLREALSFLENQEETQPKNQ
ncbi:MAG: xanthan lyase [Bacteroidales bacterium]|nr:xanthan lyase [Bacteroidales bacterium]